MEARDSQPKIRPLPIDDIDGDAPQERHQEPLRRLLPLLGIVVGAIAFGVMARGLGPVRSSEVGNATATSIGALSAEPGTTTTTEPPPPPAPTLSSLFPPAADGLQMVTLSTAAASLWTWEPDGTAPISQTLVNQPLAASYNADGSLVAILTEVRTGFLVISAANGERPIFLEHSSAGLWHPTDPDLFAWTQQPDDTEITYLRIAAASAIAGDAGAALLETTLPGRHHVLLAWGDWGFVTEDLDRPAGNRVTRFDADGLSPRQLDGVFYDSTPDGTLLMARLDDTGLIPYLLAVGGTETELTGLDIGAVDFRITSNGEWVIAATQQADGPTSILARTVRMRSTRLTSISQAARIVGLSSDDRFIILQESKSSDLVFKDWNTGAEFHVPIAQNHDVGAVSL